jgi:hypothetical protein
MVHRGFHLGAIDPHSAPALRGALAAGLNQRDGYCDYPKSDHHLRYFGLLRTAREADNG